MISARNQLQATVKSVKLGTVMAEIVAQVGEMELVSVITRSSAEAMNLEAGDRVHVVIKATEVMVAKD
jgi:molybdopterin-binding protein